MHKAYQSLHINYCTIVCKCQDVYQVYNLKAQKMISIRRGFFTPTSRIMK
jgi:hypothetical protein